MNSLPLLSFLIFTPFIGMFFVSIVRGEEETVFTNSKQIFLVTAAVVFCFALGIFIRYQPHAEGFQFVEKYNWLKAASYHVGADGMSVVFAVFSSFIFFLISLLGVPEKENIKTYVFLMLGLETAVMGSFFALDAVLFFMFFEAMFIPVFFILGFWGDREKSTGVFLVHMLFSAVVLMFVILFLQAGAESSEIILLKKADFLPEIRNYLYFAMITAFAVRAALLPFHAWFVKSLDRVISPVFIVLTAVFIPTGIFGVARFALTVFPDISSSSLINVCVVFSLYFSFIAYTCSDFRKRSVYVLLCLMSIAFAGIISGDTKAVSGSVFMMFSASLIYTALLLCSEQIKQTCFCNIETKEKICTPNMFMLFFASAFTGVPVACGFIGFFLVANGIFNRIPLTAFGVVLSVVVAFIGLFSSGYNSLFSEADGEEIRLSKDMKYYILLFIAVVVVVAGIYPAPLLNLAEIIR